MWADLIENPTVILLFLGALGSLLGAAKLGSFSLDSLGVLLLGLVLGHFGLILPMVVLNFGLALFVYSVGVQAGPGFFSAFRRDGLMLSLAAILTTIIASSFIVMTAYLLGMNKDLTIGSVCGAFNSALALASIAEITDSSDIAVGFGLTFPLTLVIMTLFVRHIPDILRKDPKEGAKQHSKKLEEAFPAPETKHYKVANPACDNRSLKELKLGQVTGAVIAGIETAEGVQTPACDQKLHMGDKVKAVGTPDALEICRLTLGRETKAPIKKHRKISVRRILVSNKDVVGKSLGQLSLQQCFGATVTRIRRGGLTLSPNSTMRLRYGDRLVVIVRKDRAREVIDYLGNDLQAFYQVRLLPAFLAMSVGAVIGFAPLSLPGGIQFKLGIAGGILIVALFVGWMGRMGPLLFSMPGESLQVIRKIGALMLLAALGTQSGHGLLDAFNSLGPKMLIPGIVGIIVGLFAAMLISRKFLRHDLVETIGCTSGSLANTVALESANAVIGNDHASSTYTVLYPVAIVAQIIFAQIWFRIL